MDTSGSWSQPALDPPHGLVGALESREDSPALSSILSFELPLTSLIEMHSPLLGEDAPLDATIRLGALETHHFAHPVALTSLPLVRKHTCMFDIP